MGKWAKGSPNTKVPYRVALENVLGAGSKTFLDATRIFFILRRPESRQE
jgi:hypothetical protein